jgi:hypothetical protein
MLTLIHSFFSSCGGLRFLRRRNNRILQLRQETKRKTIGSNHLCAVWHGSSPESPGKRASETSAHPLILTVRVADQAQQLVQMKCYTPPTMRGLFILLLLAIATLAAEDTPKTMTKIEVHLEGPEVMTGSFLAQPKVIYRAGTKYCRMEEAEDSQNKIHGLLVVNEPDAWMINLYDKSARHVVDPGPTFNCGLPMFAEVDSKDEGAMLYQNLQFGNELLFFKQMGAAGQPGPEENGKKTTQYAIEIGSTRFLMFTVGAPNERPLAVARAVGGKGEVFIYTAYEEVPFDSKLFARPEGVKISEAKP